MAKCNILNDIMAESVVMPGFPRIIVTRGWLHAFLKGLGWSEGERGYASLDYTVFGREAVAAKPWPAEERDRYLTPESRRGDVGPADGARERSLKL